jgi:hypothetical protein
MRPLMKFPDQDFSVGEIKSLHRPRKRSRYMISHYLHVSLGGAECKRTVRPERNLRLCSARVTTGNI